MKPEEILALDSQDSLDDVVVIGEEPVVPDGALEEATEVPGTEEQPLLPGIEPPAPAQDPALLSMLREMRRENAAMREKLEMLEKVAKSEEGTVDPNVPGEIETLQQEIASFAENNSVMYETLLEVMEANPKFADVRDVCSRDNLDDIIDQAATNIVKRDGGNFAVVSLQLEKQIWQERNPYRKMYELIKTYHPKYAAAEKPTETPAGEVRKPAPATAPTSLATLGGGDLDQKSGWTAEKIDALPEDKLSTVPKDIYEKYLLGTLD
jgi:hypothetical protein